MIGYLILALVLVFVAIIVLRTIRFTPKPQPSIPSLHLLLAPLPFSLCQVIRFLILQCFSNIGAITIPLRKSQQT